MSRINDSKALTRSPTQTSEPRVAGATYKAATRSDRKSARQKHAYIISPLLNCELDAGIVARTRVPEGAMTSCDSQGVAAEKALTPVGPEHHSPPAAISKLGPWVMVLGSPRWQG